MSIYIIVFICEILDFWEVISSSILDICAFMMKANYSVLPGATVEASDFPVALRSTDTQVYIVYLLYSQNQGGYVSPGRFLLCCSVWDILGADISVSG